MTNANVTTIKLKVNTKTIITQRNPIMSQRNPGSDVRRPVGYPYKLKYTYWDKMKLCKYWSIDIICYNIYTIKHVI
jgi:hypothetical protein